MRVILFNREFIIAFLMRSSEQSLAMRSSILFLSGSIYKSPAEFNVVVQRSDAFPRRLLPRESSSPERFTDVSNTSPDGRRHEIRAGESLTWLQIIVLLCDCLLQQLKPLTQVGKLKLQWIRHNVFIVFCHCLFCRFLFFFFSFRFLEWLSWYYICP